MERPVVHIISTTPAEAQAVLRTTLSLAQQPDIRVIICISSGSGVEDISPSPLLFPRVWRQATAF